MNGLSSSLARGLALVALCAVSQLGLAAIQSGEGLGHIVTRIVRSGSAASSGKPAMAPFVSAGSATMVPSPDLTTERVYHYEIRTAEGARYPFQSSADFELGSCVAFSGFVDGPGRASRTARPVTLTPSDQCGK